MTATANTNGKTVRKSLAEQIDRLDAILDVLAEGINKTVTTIVQNAVKDAVQAAVQVAVTEVLTNAELQQCLHSTPAPRTEPEPTAAPSFGQKLKGWFDWLGRAALGVLSAGLKRVGWVGAKAAAAVKMCWTWAMNGTVSACRRTVAGARRGWARLVLIASLVHRLRKPALISVAVGGVIGLGCYLAGPLVAATVSGCTSGVLTWVAWVLRHVQRVLGWDVQHATALA